MTLPRGARRSSSATAAAGHSSSDGAFASSASTPTTSVLDDDASLAPLLAGRINQRFAQLKLLSAKTPALAAATTDVVQYFYKELEKLNAVQRAVVKRVARARREVVTAPEGASSGGEDRIRVLLFDELRKALMQSVLKSLDDLCMVGSAAGTQRRSNLSARTKGVLLAWLTENADRPHPNAETKKRLSAESGISVERLSNWFVNARVRILPRIIASRTQQQTTKPAQQRPTAVARAVGVPALASGGTSLSI